MCGAEGKFERGDYLVSFRVFVEECVRPCVSAEGVCVPEGGKMRV